MRIFTKSLLAFALLCVAAGVNAAMKWQRMSWTPVVHEHLSSGYNETPNVDANGVYKVYARSKEQFAAEDPEGTFQVWDTQFMVTWGEGNKLEEGQKIRFSMKMKVEADEDVAVSTQTHTVPGTYKDGGWNFSKGSSSNNATLNLTPGEWTDVEIAETEIGSGSNKIGVYTLVFNLAEAQIEGWYYFKDIKLEIYRDGVVQECLVSENGKWVPLIQNSDMEGTENTSFRLRQYPYDDGQLAEPIALTPGVGKDGTQGIKIQSNDMVAHEWDTQFWFTFNEGVPAGTKLRAKFDYRSDNDVAKDISTQAHTLNPGGIQEADGKDSYNHYEMLGSIHFTPEWQTFSKDNVTVSSDHAKAGRPMGSIAFNFNDSNPANVYYFDNVYIDRYEALNDVRGLYDGIKILFTAYTNMPDLVALNANGKSRLYAPTDCVKLTVDGVDAVIGSVEYDKSGALYVFLDEDFATEHPIDEGVEVKLSFTNPTDKNFQLVYTSGDNKEKAVEDFEADVQYDGEVVAIPFEYSSPEVQECDPENGSFNLNGDDLNNVTVTFDKPVKVKDGKNALMVAKLDDENLTIIPVDEATISLMRKPGSADLAEGQHTITLTNVFAAKDDQMIEDSPATLTFSIGPKVMNEELAYALNNASEMVEDNEDDRYSGTAFDELQAAVNKYQSEGVNYTAPSKVNKAIEDLGEKMDAMKKHHNRCSKYDENLQAAVALVANYGESKFANHELFSVLQAAVGKYEGKILKDDDELDKAIADMDANVKVAEAMFTTGSSSRGTTGIAALVERLRLGVETLTTNFGVAETDETIVAANNSLVDDDAIAKGLKNIITTKLYDKIIADADGGMYSETEDDNENIVKSGPDMTVFIKNPNVYRLSKNMEINTTDNVVNCPAGWTINSGSTKLSDGWSQVDADITDTMFEGWGATFDISQDINDLPAGLYKVNFAIGERQLGNAKKKVTNEETGEEEEVADDEKNAADLANIYAYYKTSASEEIVKQSVPYIGQSFPELSQNRVIFNDIEVKDGKLTLGFHGEGSSIFMDAIQLTLVGRAEGVDYATELQKFQTGVKDIKAAANSTVIYDLQGRRVAQPTKGLYIKNNKKVVVK